MYRSVLFTICFACIAARLVFRDFLVVIHFSCIAARLMFESWWFMTIRRHPEIERKWAKTRAESDHCQSSLTQFRNSKCYSFLFKGGWVGIEHILHLFFPHKTILYFSQEGEAMHDSPYIPSHFFSAKVFLQLLRGWVCVWHVSYSPVACWTREELYFLLEGKEGRR